MTKINTVAELNDLPVGAHVADRYARLGGDLAHWVKYDDGSWHLIEQRASGAFPEGHDWSLAEGDTAATVLADGPVTVVPTSQETNK